MIALVGRGESWVSGVLFALRPSQESLPCASASSSESESASLEWYWS